jgi:hypothetical protein
MTFLSRLPGDLKQQLQRERMKDVFAELLEATKNLLSFTYADSFSHFHPFCFVERGEYTWPTYKIGKTYWAYFSEGWLITDNLNVDYTSNLTVARSKTYLRQYLK